MKAPVSTLSAKHCSLRSGVLGQYFEHGLAICLLHVFRRFTSLLRECEKTVSLPVIHRTQNWKKQPASAVALNPQERFFSPYEKQDSQDRATQAVDALIGSHLYACLIPIPVSFLILMGVISVNVSWRLLKASDSGELENGSRQTSEWTVEGTGVLRGHAGRGKMCFQAHVLTASQGQCDNNLQWKIIPSKFCSLMLIRN